MWPTQYIISRQQYIIIYLPIKTADCQMFGSIWYGTHYGTLESILFIKKTETASLRNISVLRLFLYCPAFPVAQHYFQSLSVFHQTRAGFMGFIS